MNRKQVTILSLGIVVIAFAAGFFWTRQNGAPTALVLHGKNLQLVAFLVLVFADADLPAQLGGNARRGAEGYARLVVVALSFGVDLRG